MATAEATERAWQSEGRSLIDEAPDEQVELGGIAIAEGLVGRLDPAAFGRSLVSAAVGAARHPVSLLGAWGRFAAGVAAATQTSVRRALGSDVDGPVDVSPRDRRFGDVGWTENAWFYFLRQRHLLLERFLLDAVEAARLERVTEAKARFAATMVADALAPSNFLVTNPGALRRAFETGGLSLARGTRNFLSDLRHNGGLPSKVDRNAFVVGRDLAATPGRVVYRNRLIELIQYEAQTETVHEIPLLFSPAWINKYYILDLEPGQSLVEWAVRHGHTAFALSYCNPDSTMADVGVDEYLALGMLEAIDVITEITGAPQVNVAAICLGGTLATMAAAYLTEHGDDRLRSVTLTNTLVDYRDPGLLGVFADEGAVRGLQRRMRGTGYLDSKDMARTFDFLRANDLVWSYVGSSWLMGEKPAPFALLSWNADSTRMPAKMHAYYLDQCYLKNNLANDEMEVLGSKLAVSKIEQDFYVLAAVEDHIVPWRSSYRTTQVIGGEARFVLCSAGHIAGVVNPPSPKTRYWTNPTLGSDPDAWRAGATEVRESWWEDWARWIAVRAGEQVPARQVGSAAHPALGPAPGTYVFG